MEPQSAQSVVLQLLSAVPEGLPVTALLDGCAIMGSSSNSVRVALSRLKRRELIESASRGFYRLGPAARAVQQVVSTWREAANQIRDWDGGWLAVHSAMVPKSERRATRNRARALRLLGMRELTRDLHIRPNNLRATIDETRRRLYELGLDDRELVFVLDDLDDGATARAMELWDGDALMKRHRDMTARLVAAQQDECSAQEAFVLGSEAIRLIVSDPLLPEPIVDPAIRIELIAAMRRFDAFGRDLWRCALVGEASAVA